MSNAFRNIGKVQVNSKHNFTTAESSVDEQRPLKSRNGERTRQSRPLSGVQPGDPVFFNSNKEVRAEINFTDNHTLSQRMYHGNQQNEGASINTMPAQKNDLIPSTGETRMNEAPNPPYENENKEAPSQYSNQQSKLSIQQN